MADITDKFWELFRAVSTDNNQSTPAGEGWYENISSGVIYYFKTDGPPDPTKWTYMDPGYMAVTETENAIAKSDRGKLENYFSDVVDQVSFSTADYNRLRRYFVDLFATHRTLGTIATQATDPHSLSNSDLDELFRSFGYPYSTQLRGLDENPLEQKIQFFLDLVNLYKVKGTPQSVIDVMQYYGVTKIDIYEFFLKLKDTSDNLVFEGKAVAGTSVNPGVITLPYSGLVANDPHWIYTKQQILTLNQSLSVSLPSKTPYLGIQPAVDIDGPEMSMLVRNVQDQYAYYESTGTLPVKNAEVTYTGTTVTLLELYLANVYVFNEIFDVGADATSYICYDGTNTTTATIVAEYDAITTPVPTSREDIKERVALYNDTFSRATPRNFLVDETTAGALLATINPSLKTSLDAARNMMDLLLSLLKDLSAWVRTNIGFGFIDFGFILFGLTEFFRDLKPVIDFFKPYRARLVLIEALQIRTRLFNTIIVDDDLLVNADLQFVDQLTGNSEPCCSGDSTSTIPCEAGDYQTRCVRQFVGEVPTTQTRAGLWVDGNTYSINDIVPDYLSNTYICIQAHTAGQQTKPPVGSDYLLYWRLVSQIDCTSSLDIKTYHSRDSYDCGSYFDIGAATDISRGIDVTCILDIDLHLRCPAADGTGAVTSEIVSGTIRDDVFSYQIPDGTSMFTVTFPEALPSVSDGTNINTVQYAIGASLRKETAGTSIYNFIITSKTQTGFSVLLNGQTDDDDYYLDWYTFSDATASWGIESLAVGNTSATITFPTPQLSTAYAVSLAMVNEDATSTVSIYSYSITDKTIEGFTVQFSAPIDSNNYKLEWYSIPDSTISGNYQLPSGVQSATIPVSVGTLYHTEYPLLVSFASDSTALPAIYSQVVTDKTLTGFTVNFSSIIDSDNYYLSWIIPDTSSPGFSQLDYYQSGGFRNFDGVPAWDGTSYVQQHIVSADGTRLILIDVDTTSPLYTTVEGTEGRFDCTHGFDLVQITIEDALGFILVDSPDPKYDGVFLLQQNGGRLRL